MPDWVASKTGSIDLRFVDLAQPGGIADLAGDQDVIIHTAGKLEDPAIPAWVFERDNVRATEALIDGALAGGCRRIINFSTLSVYGTIDVPVVDETTPSVRPTDYGASKVAAEVALRRAAPELSSISLRLPGIVGSHAHSNWLSRCRAAFLAGDPVAITNPGFRFNNVVHAEDLSAFIVALCSRGWSGAWAFPIGAGEPMPVLAMMERMKVATGSISPLTIVESDRQPFSISSQRAIREFGYRPVDVSEIIDRFAAEP